MKSMINFKNLNYLKQGNSKQKLAYHVLVKNQVLETLEAFNPILVGTIPINIDIETSDLDIICFVPDKPDFQNLIIEKFGEAAEFKIWENNITNPSAIVSSFMLDGFEIELFGQNIPTSQQNAYRHMLIEHQILMENVEAFRQRIIELKKNGLKTEPAFAKELNLQGDPYEALLKFDLSKI